jgi:hypothetical protein
MGNSQLIPLSALSGETLLEVCRAAEVIACECPGYIARLIRQVRAFRQYTTSCIEQFPKDTETHLWLAQQAQQVETMLLETMIELMRREELLENEEYLSLEKLSERAREIIIKQIR